MNDARLTAHQKRQRLRRALADLACVSPASVHDALSARVAEAVGHELGMLGGSVASAVTLSAPDVTIITLTELSGLVRSICRNSNIALFVDADHGYGNALSVRRTIEELEHAGASGCSIEDTLLPARFGQTKEEIIPLDEMVEKLRAAVAARQDSSFVIAGRTIAMKLEGLQATIVRLKAYAATGVDAIFVLGLTDTDELRAIQREVALPILLGALPTFASREELAALGVRIALQGHIPYAAAIEMYRSLYAHLKDGGETESLKHLLPNPEFLNRILQKETYR